MQQLSPPLPRTAARPAVADKAPPEGDPLTGALPRAAFEATFEAEIRRAREDGTPLSLLVVDVDHFKSINDAFGHARGDEVLCEFTRRVAGIIRRSDLLFRYGGDEFVLLLPLTNKDQATFLAHRLLTRVGGEPFQGTPPVSVTLSIGVASFPDEAAGARELFDRSDRRVYEAKRRGRAQLVSDDLRRTAADRLEQAARLLDREDAIHVAQDFLQQLPAAGYGALTISGPGGSGRSRFLAEIRQAAGTRGYEVITLRGNPALRTRAFGALIESRREFREPLPTTPDGLAELLVRVQRDRRRSGLVILFDNADQADEDTMELLEELSRVPALGVVGLVLAVDERACPPLPLSDAPLRREVGLGPISRSGIRTWIRGVLRWEPPEEMVDWVAAESGRLPAEVQRALQYLVDERLLVPGTEGWTLETSLAGLRLPERAAGSAAAGRAGIPVVSTTLVGRDADVGEVKALLRESRLVTLAGPGGIGKTRLAVQVAAEQAEHFAHGAFFIPLAPLSSPQFIVSAIAEAVHLTFAGPVPPEDQLLSFLADRQMLLVMDNFEHLVDGAGLISEMLRRTAGVRIVVTTRERLNLQEERVHTLRGIGVGEGEEPLADPRNNDAVRLFVQRARKHQPGFALAPDDLPAVDRIVHAVGGLPLGIELAASLVRVLSCEEIADEVGESYDTLVTPLRDSPAQHQSLRAVFDYSWKLLTDRERRSLRMLSVFRGGFRRESAAKVAETPFMVLASLVDKSLLVRHPTGRYEIHEVFRTYAAERLRGEEEEWRTAHERRAVYFADFLRARTPELCGARQLSVQEEIADEIENLREGWRWVVAHAREEELRAYAASLFHFFNVRGWYHEGEEAFGGAAASFAASPPLQGYLLARQGFFSSRLGRYERARELHRRSLGLLGNPRANPEAAFVFWNLGCVALKQGHYDTARRYFRRSLAVYRVQGERHGAALCFNELGALSFAVGNVDEAEGYFRRSMQIRKELGDVLGTAQSLNNMGLVSDARGAREAALSYFRQSLAVSREMNDRRSTAQALHNLGVFMRRDPGAGEEGLRDAQGLIKESLQLFEDIGAREQVALAQYNLGDVLYALGNYRLSMHHFQRGLGIASEIEAAPLVLALVMGIATLLEAGGERDYPLELLLIAGQHSALSSEVRVRVEAGIARLRAGMSPEAAADAAIRARTRSLNSVVQELAAGRDRNALVVR
ncbi:MAG TPA: diguanylate cyclase [Longimicrobiaceae bacterium]|nr:diguanylate cyclase [Longimicrobiaceae bacterium]